MTWLRERARQVLRTIQVARLRGWQVRAARDDRRFEERHERQQAGIYEPPHAGGF